MRFWIVALLALASCKKATPAESFGSDEGACVGDQDCVISCEMKGDCCGDPFCDSVQLRATAEANAAANAKECTDDRRKSCPDVGGLGHRPVKITPRCKSGACVAERTAEPGAAGSEVVDTTGYDRSCKTAADCKIVKDDPCNHCSCADKPIAAAQLARFQEAASAIKCGPRAEVVCGECRGSVPDCVDGKCIAKPE